MRQTHQFNWNGCASTSPKSSERHLFPKIRKNFQEKVNFGYLFSINSDTSSEMTGAGAFQAKENWNAPKFD